jgi:hypothetical protein
MRDQDALVDVLRQRKCEGVWADAAAEVGERQLCGDAGRRAHGELLQPHAGGKHILDDADLAVELERAGLDGERTRCHAWTCGLVEDADRHAETGEPEGKRQPGWSGASDQHFRL